MIDQWGKGAKYWDKAWNPVIGCKKVSEGCKNCYAEAMCKRFPQLNFGDFLPVVRCGVKPPKTGVVFVGNMTDLFGDWNRLTEIYEWLHILSPNARNLILTKRAGTIRDLPDELLQLDHVFYGVTAENQDRLEYRVTQLMKSGAKRKWISIEPLLGPLNIAPYLLTEHQKRGFDNQYIAPECKWQYNDKLDWVVVGAESGSNRTPCKLEWIESVVDDCLEWDVPVFVKQLDLNGKLVTDINKFPPHLQIRQVPWMERTVK